MALTQVEKNAAYYARHPHKLTEKRQLEKRYRDRLRYNENPVIRETFLAKERARYRRFEIRRRQAYSEPNTEHTENLLDTPDQPADGSLQIELPHSEPAVCA